nr:MAG: polyprotein [Iflaviridae sp.]
MAFYPCKSQIPASSTPGAYAIDNVWKMKQREHAIINVATSNDIKYMIKYENLRPFLPVQTDEVGETTGASYGTLELRCWAPLRIADTGNPTCPIQLFARFVNHSLTGMRYPLALETHSELVLQMAKEQPSRINGILKSINAIPAAIPVVGPLWKLLGSVLGNSAVAVSRILSKDEERIKRFESSLNYIGMINKDRPVDISHPSPLLPLPVHSYAHGRGPYSSKKFRIEPEATTPFTHEHMTVNTTQSYLDLAQIPGESARFQVSTTNAQGDLLIDLPAMPWDPRYANQYPTTGLDALTGNRMLQLPPVTYLTGMFQYYAGSIVYEFKAIKTPSHNFSIQVAFVPFDGTPGSTTDAQIQSCTWKTIDFRSSDTGSFEVPWLSTNPMRMYPISSPGLGSTPEGGWAGNQTYADYNIEMKDPGKVVVRLVNELNPTPIVSNVIDVIVTMRAHSNFRFLTPSPSRFVPIRTQALEFLERNGVSAASAPVFPTLLTTSAAYNSPPVLQMANVQIGEEDTIPELALRQAFGPQIQSMEKHDNILDNTRRFMHWTTITGANFNTTTSTTPIAQLPYLASVPITVYSHTCYSETAWNTNTRRLNTPVVNFRDATAQMFRWGRGSLDLALHNVSDFPIIIKHQPPTDRPYYISGGLYDTLAQYTLPLNTLPTFFTPALDGQAAEVIEPRVNPIQTIEIPFYNINNFYDLQAPLFKIGIDTVPLTADYPKQDMVALTAGQLTIQQMRSTRAAANRSNPDNAFQVHIESAIADDFQFLHFMGTPLVVLSPAMQLVPTQTHNHVIPDIPPVENQSERVLTRREIETSLLSAGIESNPGPGALSRFFKRSSPVDESSDTPASEGFFSHLKQLVSTPSQLLRFKETALDRTSTFIGEVESALAFYLPNVTLLQCTQCATSLAAALHPTTNIFAILNAILSVLVLTCAFAHDAIQRALSRLSSLLSISDDTPLTSEIGFDTNEAVCALFSSIIIESALSSCSARQVSIDEGFVKSTIIRYFGSFNYARAGAMCLLFTRFAFAVKWLYKRAYRWIIGMRRHDLLINDPKFLQGFMEDHAFLMAEMNQSAIHMVPGFRDRYWTTVITAFYLKSLMAEQPEARTRNPALLSAVNDVIRQANLQSSRMSAPPVRYEPFVLWLYGPPGTGKSSIIETLMVDCLHSIGVTYAGPPVYTRSPHSKFFNGYYGNPGCLIDDANAVDAPDILPTMISEFQAMKTCVQMRIEKPRLEEKDAEFTSLILGVCSNLNSWNSTTIRDKEAFLRRRDCLVKLTFSKEANKFFDDHPKYHRVASSLPKEMLKDNAHMVFEVAENPVTMTTTHTFTFAEFKTYLLEKHNNFHEREKEKMLIRYENSLRLARNVAPLVMDRTTLKAALIATLVGDTTEGNEVPLESLRRKYLELEKLTPAEFKKLPKHTQALFKGNTMLQSQKFKKLPPGAANPDSTHWFRTHLPEYFASSSSTIDQPPPSVMAQIAKGFVPWKHEEYVEFLQEDAIISKCAACLERKPDTIGGLCYNSTASHQHYYCRDCWKKATRNVRFLDPLCPVCRKPSLVKLTDADIAWRWYHKLGHIVAYSTLLVLAPVAITLEFIWQHSVLIASGLVAASAVALAGCGIHNYVDSINKEAMLHDKFNEFIELTGAVPSTYQDMRDGSWIFVVDNQHYKMQNGTVSPLVNRLASEGGKKTKNKENSFSTLPVDEKNQEFKTPHETPPAASPIKTQSSECAPLDQYDIHLMTPPLATISKLPPTISCEDHPKAEEIIYDAATLKVVVYDEKVKIIRSLVDSTYTEVPLRSCSHCTFYNEFLLNLSATIVKQELPLWRKQYKAENNLDDCINLNPFLRENFLLLKLPKEHSTLAFVKSKFSIYIKIQKQFIKDCSTTLHRYFRNIYDWVCKRLYYLISFFLLLFCLFCGYKYKYSEEEGYSILTSEMSSVDPGSKHQQRARNQTRTFTPRSSTAVNPSGEMYVDHQIPPGITSKLPMLRRNLVTLTCGNHFNKGICISGSKFLFPRHSLLVLEFAQNKGLPLVIEQEGNMDKKLIKSPIRSFVVNEWQSEDLVLLNIPGVTGKTLLNHFKQQKEAEVTYPPFGYVFDVTDQELHPVKITSVETEPLDVPFETIICGEKVKYETTLPVYIVVEGVQGSGKCISPLLTSDGTIIGLHMAGESLYGIRRGYHVPVFHHMFSSNLGLEIGKFPNLKPLYRLDKVPWNSTKTKILPSAIAEHAWDSLTEPCIQSRNDPRYLFEDGPLADGAASIGDPTIPPDPVTLNLATMGVMEELFKNMPTPTMTVPVSIVEAVTAQNHCNVESMNLSTSAGIPLILENPSRTKKSDYIHDRIIGDNRTVTLDPKFKEMYDSTFSLRTNGVPPRQPFCAHLKDERRKPEKARAFSGTRVFHMAPLELTLTSRRVLLPFMDALHSDPVKLHHAIGLSPDSPQWTRLIESLRVKSNKIIQLDFKKFSDSMPTDFITSAFSIIRNYYLKHGILTAEVDNILNTLCYETARPVVAIESVVYELLNGTLQGHPLTSIINSLVNLIEQVYVWIILTKKSPSEFFELCGIVVMGDDVVISVPSRMLSLYNGTLIASAFKAMAIIVTDESKDINNVQNWQPIQKFDFLSRSFALHPFREFYLAPADLNSVFDTPLWIKRKDDPSLDATFENVEQSLLLMYGHGPYIYEMYRATLLFLTDNQYPLRSWHELDYQFFGQEGLIERPITNLTLNDAAGSSHHKSLLEAGTWLTGSKAVSGVAGCEYFGENFLMNVRLDTQGTVIGYYRCNCRYNCEEELLERIKKVELRTRVPKEQFLPFTSQEAGIWASRPLPPTLQTSQMASGSSSIIATTVLSDLCDSIGEVVDGTRDRVLTENSSRTNEMSFTIQGEKCDSFLEDVSLEDLDEIEPFQCPHCIWIEEIDHTICLEHV